jgi:hypothetical protein
MLEFGLSEDEMSMVGQMIFESGVDFSTLVWDTTTEG